MVGTQDDRAQALLDQMAKAGIDPLPNYQLAGLLEVTIKSNNLNRAPLHDQNYQSSKWLTNDHPHGVFGQALKEAGPRAPDLKNAWDRNAAPDLVASTGPKITKPDFNS